MTRRFSACDSDHVFHQAPGRARRAQMCARSGKWISLNPNESSDLTINGTGILRKLWCVFNADGKPLEAMNRLKEHRDLYRNIWIHIAFDDSDVVQVSAPLADFFLFGHGDLEDIDSYYFQSVRMPPLNESPYQGALTCFVPMPFEEGAKISFVNRNTVPVRLIASFDWVEHEHLQEPFYHFRATYTHKRSNRGPMVLLDARNAEGRLIGVGLYVNNRDVANRWHEAGERFEVDDGQDLLVGTGGEDYFCQAWGFRRLVSRPQFGVTCVRPHRGSPTLKAGTFNSAGEYAMYRLHVDDCVSFNRSLRMSFATGGVGKSREPSPFEFRSVAFWFGRDLER